MLFPPEVISALIQVPLVLAFMVFTLAILQRFICWQGEQNEVLHEFMAKAEETNREFCQAEIKMSTNQELKKSTFHDVNLSMGLLSEFFKI